MTETASSFPRLNEPAPDFHAKTTHGERSLAGYKTTDWYFSTKSL